MSDRIKKLMLMDVKAVPHEYLWAAFLLPVFLLAAAFFSLRVHPLGDNSLLMCDLFHQYTPILTEFRRKILSGESLFFSWNIGLGSNFWPILTYNCASPLNFIVLLFPEKNISDAITVMILLRTGLSGLFFSLLISGKDKKEGPSVLALSTLYALSGFVLSYFWAVMWMDAIVLLPLVILGLWRLITEKKAILYIITLFITVFTNFYFGFFVCLFLASFFFLLYMEARQKDQAKPFMLTFLRFAGSSVLACLMTGILLLPTVLALTKTAAATEKMQPSLELSFPLFDLFTRFLLHSDPVIREGLPNVFCGVLLFLVVPLYLFCGGIPFWRRFATSSMAVFLFVSMANPYLNFIWHGLHVTNQIPYRQAFLLVFLLLYAAVDLFLHIEKIARRSIFGASFLSLGYLILLNRTSEAAFDPWLLYGSAFFIIAYAVILTYHLREAKVRGRAEKALLYLVILEVFLSAEFALANLSETEHFTYYDAYAQHAQEISSEVQRRDNGSFTRAAILPQETGNDGALFNIKSIPSFLSTTPQSTVTFLASLGFANNERYEVSSDGLTEVSARILGLKHVISYTDAVTVDDYIGLIPSEEQTSSQEIFLPDQDKMFGSFTISSDENVLPVGFAVPTEGLSYQPDPALSPFESTNALLREMGGEDVYHPVDRIDLSLSNLESFDQKDQYNFLSVETFASYTFQPTNYVAGDRLYLFVRSDEKIAITINYTDDKTGDKKQRLIKPLAGQIIDCGILPPEESEYSVRVSLLSGSTKPISISCATVAAASLDSTTRKLKDFSLTDISYRSDSISGMIPLPSDSCILFTIPYDEGWTATVDGQKAETVMAYGALLAVPATPGTHQIDLSYSPPGFEAGILVTIGSVLLFAGMIVYKHLPNKRRQAEIQQE